MRGKDHEREHEQEQRSENQMHNAMWAHIAEVKQAIAGLKEELCELNEIQSTIINIEHLHVINIGGQMPLDLSKLVAEVTADTTVGDELDTVVDAVVAAYSGATSQAEIDAVTAQLNKNTTRQQLKTAALKNLVGPGSGGGGGGDALAASYGGEQVATVGASYQGQVTVTGGTAPYTHGTLTGVLPSGLSFNPDGSVSGIPDTAGASSFGGSVTDAAGATAQWSGAISVS